MCTHLTTVHQNTGGKTWQGRRGDGEIRCYGWHFSTPCLVIDISSRQKINKHIVFLSSTIDQFDLIGIYRTLHPKIAEYIFFSSYHGILDKLDQLLGHKTHLNMFKRIEVRQSMFIDHNSN